MQAFVIYSKKETAAQGEPMFWSNAAGWVDLSNATRFTAAESKRYRLLPVGADCWMKLSEAKALVSASH